MPSQVDRVIERWSAQAENPSEFSAAVYWLAIPEVHAYFTRRATGGLNYPDWVTYCLGEFLAPILPAERMLSIGCGTGGLERQLAAKNAFAQCDAFDISSAAIDLARQHADEAGFHHIEYRADDGNHVNLPFRHYDAIWFNGSLHHIEALEHLLLECAGALKPNGWLLVNEYVGASRFALTSRQKTLLNALFAMIPERYRRSFVPGAPQYASAPAIPDPLMVAHTDPSEAVRSGEILEVLQRYFTIVRLNKSGGSLLQFLLSGIAGNFAGDDLDAKRVLQILMQIEETLIDIGDLESDFVLIAAQAK